MKLLAHILCLCLALALSWAHHEHGHTSGSSKQDHHGHAHGAVFPDRCQGLEMDAATVNEEGIPYFFKGPYLWKGFHGKAELANQTFAELDDHHHLGHTDAALRMHFPDRPNEHDRLFFFLDNKVFSFYKHKLEDGYPKDISEVFPGIPDHLEAAVECPKPDCAEDSLIFFKKHEIFHFNLRTKAVEEKPFTLMKNCTSAFRFMEHYYCFEGHLFYKFDPKTGNVHGKYPKEARDFFMRCSKFSAESDHVERERCSRVHLDAITSDDAGNIYAFRGHHFIRKEVNDTLESDAIEKEFKEVHSEVDAAFSYQGNIHIIKDNNVFVYKLGEPHTLLPGYPKTVKQDLGLDGPISAAFVCQDHHIAHVIKGNEIYDVELRNTPRVAGNKRPISVFKKVDTAMCGPEGVKVFVGNHFYEFATTTVFVAGRALPEQHKVSLELFGCDH